MNDVARLHLHHSTYVASYLYIIRSNLTGLDAVIFYRHNKRFLPSTGLDMTDN